MHMRRQTDILNLFYFLKSKESVDFNVSTVLRRFLCYMKPKHVTCVTLLYLFNIYSVSSYCIYNLPVSSSSLKEDVLSTVTTLE
jgi:hypothetical protein